MVKAGLGAGMAMLLGCFVSSPSPPYPKESTPASSASSATTTATPDAPPPSALETRLVAAVEMAKEAVALEGSEPGARLSKQTLRDCAYGLDDCVSFINATVKGEDTNLAEKVVLLSSAVLTIEHKLRTTNDRRVRLSSDQYVDVAERTAKQARAYADQLVQKRAEIAAMKEKAADESAKIDALDKECASSAAPCKTKCDAGDGLACAALANKLEAEGKKADAQKATKKACDLSVQSACLAMKHDEAEKKKVDAKNDSAWQDVQENGDDLTRKQFQLEMFSKIAAPHQQSKVAQMRVIVSANATEKFCPTKKSFIAAAGQSEFNRRATSHCRDEPPQASGLSGAQVTLTTQCQAAFSTGCR
ncbi:MAG: hypothetical protein U0270_33535 [Labilithrix sp.]